MNTECIDGILNMLETPAIDKLMHDLQRLTKFYQQSLAPQQQQQRDIKRDLVLRTMYETVCAATTINLTFCNIYEILCNRELENVAGSILDDLHECLVNLSACIHHDVEGEHDISDLEQRSTYLKRYVQRVVEAYEKLIEAI